MRDNNRTSTKHLVVIVIVAIICYLLTLLVYDIFKIKQESFIFATIFYAVFVFLHFMVIRDAKKWIKGISWLVLFALIVSFFFMASPDEKRLSAVNTKSSKATDVVSISQGKLSGVYNDDSSVKVYAGIPYAKPPVGELRWREPQDPDNWSGIRVCDTFAPMAMQNRNSYIYDFLTSTPMGYNNFKLDPSDNYLEEMSEDCLYLNVWAPADIKPDDKLPVLMYIHGGSLNSGQSYFSDYNGEALAKKGIIVVTIAYRVGIFGYMANDELKSESPNGTTGNYGLLDQIKALDWVNNNIEAFGGDASNITIAGESAGASSVNAVCVSPLAKGKFRRAIAESSGITAVVPYHTFRSYEEAIEDNADVLKEYKCSSIKELRKVPAEKLLASEAINQSMTIDGYAITKQPYLTYLANENNEEAILGGFNASEADVFLMFSPKPKQDNYEQFLEKPVGKYAKDLAKLYPASSDKQAKENYTDIMGLAWFGYSHYNWSKLMANNNRDAYLYYFSRENKGIGTYHAGEMPYFYGNLDTNKQNYDDRDYELSNQITSYIVNYCKTGNPNGKGLPTWKTYNEDNTQYMELGNKTAMTKDKFLQTFQLIDRYQNSLKTK